MKDHQVSVHTDVECGCVFLPEEKTVLKSHSRDCKSMNIIKDTQISGQGSEKDVLVENTEREDTLAETVVICGLCAKGFESRRYCDEHILNAHGQEQDVESDECEEILQSNPKSSAKN